MYRYNENGHSHYHGHKEYNLADMESEIGEINLVWKLVENGGKN